MFSTTPHPTTASESTLPAVDGEGKPTQGSVRDNGQKPSGCSGPGCVEFSSQRSLSWFCLFGNKEGLLITIALFTSSHESPQAPVRRWGLLVLHFIDGETEARQGESPSGQGGSWGMNLPGGTLREYSGTHFRGRGHSSLLSCVSSPRANLKVTRASFLLLQTLKDFINFFYL